MVPADVTTSSRLDALYHEITLVILSRQNAVTGLLPASTAINAHGDYTDAWVRDNVYSILAVWGLALAYRKVDADEGRTLELEGGVIKLMRGLLSSMMRQADKVERFKLTQAPGDSLHAKYGTQTGTPVVGDFEWGHLQLDATSLFLLILAQMTASGLNIVLTIDEVNFVQNLVYYIGRTYQTPDYGIWERGNKSNSGHPELNASSIGMAKAALEALNGLDLFGVRGSQTTVIHVSADEIARARITLESLLPWESSSKEVDAALLGVIGYPAFAVEDAELAARTRDRIVERLQGKYGCKRFLRDGHQAVLEDATRLHYEPWELKQFENIESEWPLFFTYLLLDGLYRKDADAVGAYDALLQPLFVEQCGRRLLPELYFVPSEKIAAEKEAPGTQVRVPNENVPLVWAQSLYYLGQMIKDGLLHLGDIDPLGRHHRIGRAREPVVQIVLLAEDEGLQLELEAVGIASQVPAQLTPLQVRQPEELAAAYNQIGRNDKLGLTGRPVRRLRSLTTSKVFRIRGELMLFLPSFPDQSGFYLTLDEEMYVEQLRSELDYIHSHWRQLGRPTLTLLITRSQWQTGHRAFTSLMAELKEGRCGSVAVHLGPVHELIAVAARERIDFLHDFEFAEEPLNRPREVSKFLLTNAAANELLSPLQEFAIERRPDSAALLLRLRHTSNLFEQIELLQNLATRCGLQFAAEWDDGQFVTIETLLTEVYDRAGRGDAQKRPYWSIVRRAAGLLGKIDLSLADAVTDILVSQKQITVGKAYFDDALIARPLQSHEIQTKIHRFARDDVREQVMTQEILIYLGLLIRTAPGLFSGMMTLRTGYLIVLLTTDLADEREIRQEEAYDMLMGMSPSEVQRRLRRVLGVRQTASQLLQRQESLHAAKGSGADIEIATADDSAEPKAPSGGWLSLRIKQGSLSGVPAGFFPQVWKLLHHCRGLVIGEKFEMRNRLESAHIVAEMTAGEKNFAVWLEHLLGKIEFPEYRQLNVEAMVALAEIAENNPGLRIDSYITLDVLIGHAVRLAWLEGDPSRAGRYDEDKPAAWRAYYESSPAAAARAVGLALQFLMESATES